MAADEVLRNETAKRTITPLDVHKASRPAPVHAVRIAPPGTQNERRRDGVAGPAQGRVGMLKFLGSVVGIIFLIGLLVVIGIFALIF